MWEGDCISILYVDEDMATIGVSANRVYIKSKDGFRKEIPIETLESINVTGKSQITTGCIIECLKRGITITFYSKGGRYYGKVLSLEHVNVERQRLQCELYDSLFAIDFSKIIIQAKLRNQSVVLRRYEKSKGVQESESVKTIKSCRNSIEKCKSIYEIMGYEGQAAKAYFNGLASVIDEKFTFNGRNRRPPKDPFNSMLSLGYSIISNEIYGKVEAKGMNPYFGFMHRDREKHPTLVSDLMEEWRAVIVDSVVMSMINGHEIHPEDFYMNYEDGSCYMTKEGISKFVNRLEKKMSVSTKYLDYIEYPVTFKYAISLQLNSLVYAMINKDASLYKPLIIR